MSLTYGFFNSLNGDRVYDAEEFASFLDGIVYDGVYAAVGNKFYVQATSGMNVTVDTGRAWFDHTWTLNTTKLALTLQDSDTIYDRIDAVVLEINKTTRMNSIKVIAGTPSEHPAKPALIKTTLVKQYPLAYITVPVRSSNITQSNIQYMVDTSETPLCSALALAGIPSGGKVGYVLAKKSSESGSVDWYDINKLPYDKWYLADGVRENNVLGAYKFVHRNSLNESLTSVSEDKSRVLTAVSEPGWNASQGVNFFQKSSDPWAPYLSCASLSNDTSIRTVICKYTIPNQDSNRYVILGLCSNFSEGHVYSLLSGKGGYNNKICVARYVQAASGEEATGGGWSISRSFKVMDKPSVSGVFGVSSASYYSCNTYFDGLSIGNYSVEYGGADLADSPHHLIGGCSSRASVGDYAITSWYLEYIIYYNIVLNAEQHQAISRQIVSDSLS